MGRGRGGNINRTMQYGTSAYVIFRSGRLISKTLMRGDLDRKDSKAFANSSK